MRGKSKAMSEDVEDEKGRTAEDVCRFAGSTPLPTMSAITWELLGIKGRGSHLQEQDSIAVQLLSVESWLQADCVAVNLGAKRNGSSNEAKEGPLRRSQLLATTVCNNMGSSPVTADPLPAVRAVRPRAVAPLLWPQRRSAKAIREVPHLRVGDTCRRFTPEPRAHGIAVWERLSLGLWSALMPLQRTLKAHRSAA